MDTLMDQQLAQGFHEPCFDLGAPTTPAIPAAPPPGHAIVAPAADLAANPPRRTLTPAAMANRREQGMLQL